ncbi:MAG TPA: tRNA pseudouridine(13) synthase TruD [Planctomycetaceae bacterium]|nr:tRNA pseudouridine(13) synthase TruD [Planctomycetaceae bacterium]
MSDSAPQASAPRLTGRIKCEPEDFVVEELPAYLPSGEGEHLFLWLEKRDVPAEQLLRHVARALEVDQRDIGAAGMKDRRGVTRQWVSVPARAHERVGDIDTDRIRVLSQVRHGNKLRTGHLTGNRFSILVRDVASTDGPIESAEVVAQLAPLVDDIRQFGFANFFGDQRFGREGETLQLGLDLLAGRKTPRDIPYSRRRFLLKLSLSAVQSDLFNQALTRRIADGLLHTVLAGDVMEVVASGGKFTAEDAAVEQPRRDAGETAITGPLFGPKMRLPTGAVAEREQQLLEQSGLTMDSFRAFPDLLSGTRRPYAIRPGELSLKADPDGVRLDFTLPPGVYATTLLGALFDLDGERGDVSPPGDVE